MALPPTSGVVPGQQNAALYSQTIKNDNVIGSQPQQKDESTSERVQMVYVQNIKNSRKKLVMVNANGTFRDFKVAIAKAFNISEESILSLTMSTTDNVYPSHYEDNTPLTQFNLGIASVVQLICRSN